MSDAPDPPTTTTPGIGRPAAPRPRSGPGVLRTVWRSGWVLVAVVAFAYVGWFVLHQGASVLYYVVMAFFLALAMEPAVAKLTPRMPRSAATGVVMLGVALAMVVFVWQFGSLLFDQLASLVTSVPDTLDSVIAWVNARFGTTYRAETLLTDLGVTTDDVSGYATKIAGGVLGVLGNVLSAALGTFTLVFFCYFMSAGMPRLRGWVAGLFPPRQQVVVLTTWELIRTKVGGYVAARLVLAVISGTVSGLFMLAIGMPYWLPLAMWTGIISQFIPNVGTYIAIALPVIVGLTSNDPKLGMWVLLFAVAYQQVENLTLEPRISAKAVDVYPAVSFGAALLGAQLFGLSGAALGVPVAATVMALFDIYKARYDITEETEGDVAALVGRIGPNDDGVPQV